MSVNAAPLPLRPPAAVWPWAIAAGIITMIVWSALGTDADMASLLRPNSLAAMWDYALRMFPPDLSLTVLREVGVGIVETFAISLAGTGLAVAMALGLGLLGTRTILFDGIMYTGEGFGWRRVLRVGIYGCARAILSLLRTIPEIVWAVIFVFAVGLGPFPGVLALGVHTTGVLGKLFSEVLEDVPSMPVEALHASGASRTMIVFYGILPQSLPQVLSYSLYRWEVNIRAAAILGFVGAGGLGQRIYIAINLFHEHRLLTLILAIYVTVTLVDALSTSLRRWVR